MGSLVILLIFVCILEIRLIAGMGFGMEPMVGKGMWIVLDARRCDDPDQYSYQFEIEQYKINRTHHAFSGILNALADIDDSYAIRIEPCKWMDGGCKPFQTISDDCFCCFVNKHTGINFKLILEDFGIDPPDCPIPQGYYKIENYIFNYEELPEEGFFGKYDTKIFLVKDGVDLGCMMLVGEFS